VNETFTVSTPGEAVGPAVQLGWANKLLTDMKKKEKSANILLASI
jgi:hypothetical protein